MTLKEPCFREQEKTQINSVISATFKLSPQPLFFLFKFGVCVWFVYMCRKSNVFVYGGVCGTGNHGLHKEGKGLCLPSSSIAFCLIPMGESIIEPEACCSC